MYLSAWFSSAWFLTSRVVERTGWPAAHQQCGNLPCARQLVRSTYHPAFSRLVEEVEASRQEANDNVKFLKPLRKWVAASAVRGALLTAPGSSLRSLR